MKIWDISQNYQTKHINQQKTKKTKNRSWNVFKSKIKFPKNQKKGAFSLMNELYSKCLITFLEKTNTEIPKKKHK